MNESVFIWGVAFWMAAVGGAVGSFLNVVVYRLPAGLNLSYPGSHCPKCGHPIRWHDNVPVFGWLKLRGHCRDCQTWIPLRYPAVEAFVAGLFLLIVFTEGASLGGNLPSRPVPVVDGLIFPDLSPWQLGGIVGWHLLLLCTLLCSTLIRYDGHTVPAKLFVPGFVAGSVGSLLWPHLHPQPAAMLAAGPTPGAVDALAGLATGLALGLLAWKLLEPSRRPDLIWAAALTGLLLGWQPTVVLVPTALVFAVLCKPAGQFWPPCRRVPPVAWLGLTATLWIAQWARLAEFVFGATSGR